MAGGRGLALSQEQDAGHELGPLVGGEELGGVVPHQLTANTQVAPISFDVSNVLRQPV